MDYSAKIDKLVTQEEAYDLMLELEDLKLDPDLHRDDRKTGRNPELLIKQIKGMPVVNVRLPFRIDRRMLERISLWLKNNLEKKVLLSVDHEKNRDMKVEIFYKGRWGSY